MAPRKPKEAMASTPLADAIRASGLRKPKVRRLPRMQQPDAIRLSYFRALKQLLNDIETAVKEHVVPALKELPPPEPKADGVRVDAAIMDKVHRAIERAAAWVAKRWTAKNASKVIQPIAQRTSDFSRKQLADQMRAALGVDVTMSEPWLQGEIDKWISGNVSLIKSIPSTFFADIEKRVGEMVHSGERWETLAAEIEDRMGVTKSRAALIARTETGKIYAQINHQRQQALGIKGFKWMTVRDNRVRDRHEARQGKPYEYGELSDDEMPGMEPNCRCWAQADVARAFEEFFAEE